MKIQLAVHMPYQIIFPNQQTFQLPPKTVNSILASGAQYDKPLWQFRAERVLKLGSHQWISPSDQVAAQSIWRAHPAGIVAVAWKLFNRGWSGAAEEYFYDTRRYPNHPRHYGQRVIPLVDEDTGSQQIGWVRILQQTEAGEQYAVFVQFAILEMFEARVLPGQYT